MGGWWVLDFARIKLTQPSLAGAGAELGNNVENSNHNIVASHPPDGAQTAMHKLMPKMQS